MTHLTLDPGLLSQLQALPKAELRLVIAHAAGLLAHPNEEAAQGAVKVLNSVAHALRHGKPVSS